MGTGVVFYGLSIGPALQPLLGQSSKWSITNYVTPSTQIVCYNISFHIITIYVIIKTVNFYFLIEYTYYQKCGCQCVMYMVNCL